MLFNQTISIVVVAALLLSLVQARPMLVLDADDESLNNQNGTSLQSASMKDACSDGTVACIDQFLAQCVNGRWSLIQTSRKRSRAANISCVYSQARKGYSTKYSDRKNKSSGECEHSESTVAATSTGSTAVTTTTLTPEQAKEEISRLLRSALSTAHHTSTEPSYTYPTSQTTVAGGSNTSTSDCTATASISQTSTDDCSTSTSMPYPASQTTRASIEEASSSSSRTGSFNDYSPSATSTASTTSSTAGTELGSDAIINIRLTTVPLSVITATTTSSSPTTSATQSNVDNNTGGGEGGADAIVSIRLTTIQITPTAT